MYTTEQEKCWHCSYDDKRDLLADLPDSCLNLNTNVTSNCDLAEKEHLVADQPNSGAKLKIRHLKKQIAMKHARVTRRLILSGAINMKEELPEAVVDGKLTGNQIRMLKRVAAARPRVALFKWVRLSSGALSAKTLSNKSHRTLGFD